MINPLTDYVARKKFFLETGILISEVPTEIEWREVGDVFIQILFGDDAQFEDYGENENFIAGLEIGGFENISVEDVFIHTLGILAEQKEQSVEALIESIENSGITLFEDGEFSIALSQTLQELELEEAEVEEVFVDYLEEDFYKEMDLYYDQFEELLKTPLWQNSKWVNNDAAEDLLTYSMTEAMIKLEESDEMTAPYLIYLFPPFGNHLIELMNKVVTIPDTDETMDLFEKYLSLYSNNLLSVSKSISYENWESSPSLLKIKYEENGTDVLQNHQGINDYVINGNLDEVIWPDLILDQLETHN